MRIYRAPSLRAGVSSLAICFLLLGYRAVAAQGLEEVIVTAQKREQGLQDVPISVEAFSAEQIDNLSAQDIADLGVFAPNVEIDRAANQPNYRIRGIGTSDFGVGADPAVGVYQDGVYIGRSGGSKVAFNDIARVEILNGPQGTLFGRNAAAGAIQYITNKAEDDLYGWARLTLGNYDRRQVDGVINVPLTDKLYFRSGILWNRRDGWVDNLYNGDDLARRGSQSINAQLRWLPIDRLDMTLRLEYDETDQDPRVRSSAVWGPRHRGPAFTKVESEHKLDETRYLFGTSLHLTYDMDWATLTSITSWREYSSSNPEEKDGSAELLYSFNDLNEEDNWQWSQELRLNGNVGNRFAWTAGVNYFDERAKQTSGIDLSPNAVDKLIAERQIGAPYDAFPPGRPFDLAFALIPDTYNRRAYDSGAEALMADVYSERIMVDGEYRSYAAFGDVTWDITDSLSLTAGLRWTRDEKEFSRYVEFNEFVIAFAFETETRIDAQGNYDPDGELGWYTTDDSWEKTTPRVVLDWRVTDEVMLYASYAEGYKAGGFNSTGELFAPPIEPENVTNYEVGMKSTWLDNTLRTNLAVFSYEYEDLQALEFIDGACLPNSEVGAYLFETSDVEGEGLEFSLNWLPLPALEVFFNTGMLDAEYSDRTERTAVDAECVLLDRSGEAFTAAPELTFSLGGTYTLDMSSGAELAFTAAYNWAEGAERNDCKYVVNNRDQGRSSDVYGLSEVDGQLIISDPSATGDLTDPPYSSCPDNDDFEQLNARVTYFSPGRNWEVALWVVNWTDWSRDRGKDNEPDGLGEELASAFSDGSPSYGRTDEPRMYGVEFRYNFN
jgi:iron complex outermembrane receptor protein